MQPTPADAGRHVVNRIKCILMSGQTVQSMREHRAGDGGCQVRHAMTKRLHWVLEDPHRCSGPPVQGMLLIRVGKARHALLDLSVFLPQVQKTERVIRGRGQSRLLSWGTNSPLRSSTHLEIIFSSFFVYIFILSCF